MRPLRELLETWQSWSAGDTARRLGLRRDEGAASALEALRDATELAGLLAAWQWQAIYAARLEGESWESIAAAIDTMPALAQGGYVAAIERQEQVLGRDVARYREVL